MKVGVSDGIGGSRDNVGLAISVGVGVPGSGTGIDELVTVGDGSGFPAS
jgi:hypothetical protein